MSDHEHEYTLAVRPNATIHIAYSTDDGTVEGAFLAVEYGRHGIEDVAESGEGFEWRGYEIALARDGENVLGRNVERLFDRDVPLVDRDDLKRGVDTASGYGRRLKDRIEGFRERRSGHETADPREMVEAPEAIEVSGPGGTTIDVSLAETAAAFELYEDDGENWRWRLAHENGETLAVSPSGYDSRETAEETISNLKANVLGADVEG